MERRSIARLYHARRGSIFTLLIALGQQACGGSDVTGTDTTPPPVVTVAYSSISKGGYDDACGLTSEGQAYCWGYDASGQLGDGAALTPPPNDQPIPIAIGGALRFSEISLAVGNSCGLTTSGTAYCWGATGGNTTASSLPRAVPGGLRFTTVSAGGNLGYHHACALTTDGVAYCWGDNVAGQLGTGERANSADPLPVAGGLRYTAITAGSFHTCALATDGTAYCWGDPYSTYSIPNLILTPTAIPGALKFASLDGGIDYTCGVTSTGAAYCWGFGEDGRLGDGVSHSAFAPSPVSGGISFAEISAGGSFACGISTAGAAYCWGEGFLGTGPYSRSFVPVAVSGGLSFARISVAGTHACGRSIGGRVYCWGENAHGQLGIGSTTASNVPVAVAFQP
jgi:alpha-tubulin suppressor-like RCC1 family protein